MHSKAAIAYSIDVRSVEKRAAASKEVQSQVQDAVLKAHNSRRARHCAPQLTLDPSLTQSAQAYAEKLAAAGGDLEHSYSEKYSENLFMMESSKAITKVNGAMALDSWYNEIDLYNFIDGKFSTDTGHFTQAVWKGTTKIGVGSAFSDNKQQVYIVAHYAPKGNYENRFKDNVLPKDKCPIQN